MTPPPINVSLTQPIMGGGPPRLPVAVLAATLRPLLQCFVSKVCSINFEHSGTGFADVEKLRENLSKHTTCDLSISEADVMILRCSD